jgi:hypothetical protein
VDKDRFNFLVHNFTSLNGEETRELESLQATFPYCQVVHVLTTRGAQNEKSPSSQKQLHLAAVYATDRGVLKTILGAPILSRHVASSDSESVSPISTTTSDLEGDDLINEVMADLDRLKELKHNFEITLQEYDRAVHTPPAEKKKLSEPTPRHEPNTPAAKAEVLEADSNLSLLDEEPSGDSLLEEIRNKKKLKPETSKQKEQIDIINQFIKKQPSITKNSLPAVDSPDLSEKNVSLTDNIVSETLVEILLRQGKKDKAIEVLKKLIWKFPQKKSIFAAQIEELRK